MLRLLIRNAPVIVCLLVVFALGAAAGGVANIPVFSSLAHKTSTYIVGERTTLAESLSTDTLYVSEAATSESGSAETGEATAAAETRESISTSLPGYDPGFSALPPSQAPVRNNALPTRSSQDGTSSKTTTAGPTTTTPSVTAPTTTTPTTATPSDPLPPKPKISAAVVTVAPFSASISWRTNTETRGQVVYGDSIMTLFSTFDQGVSHKVGMKGLIPGTTYHFRIDASDEYGRRDQYDGSFTTQAKPVTATSAVAGNLLTRGGEPWFPFLVWRPCGDAISDLRRIGIDVFMGDGCDTAADNGDVSKVVGDDGWAIIKAGRKSSSTNILGDYLPDEWDWNLPETLHWDSFSETLPPRQGNLPRFLTVTDHFLMPDLADSMYSTLFRAADVLGFDSYPLQSRCNRNSYGIVYDAQRGLVAQAKGKPTYQWIEVASMEHCRQADLRPTPQTIAAESWLAIAGGATGLGFFPYQIPVGANTDAVADVTEQVRALQPALLADAVQVESSKGDIRVGARNLNGALYIIAVNATESKAETTISAPTLNGRILAVWGESRTVESQDDQFVDSFAPLAVHIYIAAPDGW